MAAILCTLPCKLCSPICTCISQTCGQACKCCNDLCQCSCQACLSSPFCLFVTAATVLNIPPVVVGIKSVLDLVGIGDSDANAGGLQAVGGCRLVTWILVNAVTSAANIAAAWYLSSKVAQIDNSNSNSNNQPINSTSDAARLRNKRTAASRTAHILCYDPLIALYILVAIFYVGWLSLGGMWLGQEAASFYDVYHNDSSDAASAQTACDSDIRTQAGISLGFGWTYVMAGSITFFCSLCCTACDRRQYGNQNMPLWMPSSPEGGRKQEPLHQVNTGMVQSVAASNHGNNNNNNHGSGNLPVAFAVPAEDVVEILPPSTGTGKMGGGKSALQEQRVQQVPGAENPYASASAPPSESDHATGGGTTRASVERTVEHAKNLFGSAFAAASSAAGKKK